MIALILFGLLALAVSFVCSLLEASLLSLPTSHVESMVEQGSHVGRKLKELKDNVDRPLAAILTLNTVAHTVGAAGVGAQAAVIWGDTAVGLASAVMTLAILVLSEIIPKTLGAVHTRRLAGVTAYVTGAMIWVCLPLVVPLEWVNRLVGYQRGGGDISRMEVLATIRLGREGGQLGDREHRIVTNLMALSQVRLSEALTPRTVLFALPADRTVRQALDAHHPLRFARIPVYAEMPDHISGYVSRFDLHQAAAEGRDNVPLSSLKRPLVTLPEQASVADALEQMLDRGEHMALVVDEYGGVAGIITLEDVMECLLGQQITDEADLVADMRRLARERARHRQS